MPYTVVCVDFEFDPAKDATNQAKHGIRLAFGVLVLSDPDVLSLPDARRDYGEARTVSLGSVAGRVYVVVSTARGEAVRIISVRKANAREQRRYHQAQG